MNRNYMTIEKKKLIIESWYYSYTSSPSNDPGTQFGSTRIKTEARLVLADPESVCEHARVRWHAHVLTDLSTHGSLLAPWHTNLQTEPSAPNHFGARAEQTPWPMPFFVLRTLCSRATSACAACACMDKQRSRRG